jgi:hypothetical protein
LGEMRLRNVKSLQNIGIITTGRRRNCNEKEIR